MSSFPIRGGLSPRDEIVVRGVLSSIDKSSKPGIRLEAVNGLLGLEINLDDECAILVRSLSRTGVVLPPIRETVAPFQPDRPIEVGVSCGYDRLVISINGRQAMGTSCSIELVDLTLCTVIGLTDISFFHRFDSVYSLDWRRFAKPSGTPSTTSGFDTPQKLKAGVSFIVRARNEEENIENCLRSIAPKVEEIIFCDNNSSDRTLSLAREVASDFPNVKVFSYPIGVPRVGGDHAEAVISGSRNTLAEFYNWCLEKATCYNFTKWDADFLAVDANLSEMYSEMDLATRGDNICLYYSGIEVYYGDNRWWVDKDTMQHEYRLFSKRHRCSWVDIPPWEEIDQTYLFTANKLYFNKPVYIEIFRLDKDHFANRGVYLNDARDRARFENVAHWRKHGTLPRNFIEISGPNDRLFQTMELTGKQTKMRNRADRIWGALPQIKVAGQDVVYRGANIPQIKLVVMIVACEKNTDRIEKIRKSWAEDLRRVGITHYFVIGRPGKSAQVVGDILYLDCPDTYEGLPLKTLAILKRFSQLTFDFLIKVDDDIVLNVDFIWSCGFWRHDYFGGVVSGQWGIQPDWHFGKCNDDALNATTYAGEFRGAWFAGGCGYFLSRRAVEAAIAAEDIFESELYEDKAVGDALRKEGFLVGDLNDSFPCVSASELNVNGSLMPSLLCYDVPRDLDHPEVLAALRFDERSAAVRPLLLQEWDGVVEVVTDWCHVDEFFREELATSK